jgi:hypothetical protein
MKNTSASLFFCLLRWVHAIFDLCSITLLLSIPFFACIAQQLPLSLIILAAKTLTSCPNRSELWVEKPTPIALVSHFLALFTPQG